MRLPEIAAELRALGSQHGLARLVELAEHMKRRRNQKKAPAAAKAMTPELVRQIRAYARRNPRKTQFEIAREFGVNQGRVSVALHGERR